jgi:hypothetical protein
MEQPDLSPKMLLKTLSFVLKAGLLGAEKNKERLC